MPPPNRQTDSTPSAIWMWGFVLLAAGAFATFVLSLHAAAPLDRIFRAVSGALLLIGGAHQSRVVAYKRATRGPYSTYAPDSLLLQRQAGWSARILGVVLVASALIELPGLAS